MTLEVKNRLQRLQRLKMGDDCHADEDTVNTPEPSLLSLCCCEQTTLICCAISPNRYHYF